MNTKKVALTVVDHCAEVATRAPIDPINSQFAFGRSKKLGRFWPIREYKYAYYSK